MLLLCGEEVEEAIKILNHAAARKIETARIVDASFCHGGAGTSHIFRRFYRHTGLASLEKAADFWLDDMLDNPKYKNSHKLRTQM